MSASLFFLDGSASCLLYNFKKGTDEKPGQKINRLNQIDANIKHFKLAILFLLFLPLHSEFHNTALPLHLYIFYSTLPLLSLHRQPDSPAIFLCDLACLREQAFNTLHKLTVIKLRQTKGKI
jgi:hypothetical protein